MKSRPYDVLVKTPEFGSIPAPTVHSLDHVTVSPRQVYCYSNKSVKLNIRTVGILSGQLGWLSVERISEYSDCGDCSAKSVKDSRPCFSIRYHFPWWTSGLTGTLRFQTTPNPCLSLFLQVLLPPDAEVFVCIRTGQLERLKMLLVEQRASVTDMMAPYGLSTISLAAIHGQTEIYQFLDSAGASRVPTMVPKSTGFEVGGFWSNYSTLDCKVSAETIMYDHRYYTCSQFLAKALANLATQSCLERDSFTQLHLCTLRLTTESLETLLADTSTDVNEVDPQGRTALHLATYLCDKQAVELLLKYKADYAARDFTGRSPLRIAAALAWVEGTALLVKVSDDLGQRNPFNFGNTILHSVCFQGHARIAEILLDGGADIEEANDIGETPLRHAVVANQAEVLKVLHDRGAAFTLVDNLGCTAFHDAILVNAHACLNFILKLRVRVDQTYLTTGQTALHLLAEHADLRTLDIFAQRAQTGLGELDIAALDCRRLTALEYLHLRHDEDSEFWTQFQLLLERIKNLRSERRRSHFCASFKLRDGSDGGFEDDEKDYFTDAPERQPND